MDNTLAIATSEEYYLAPATSMRNILIAYQTKKEFIEMVLRDGVDYGTIPGAGDKKTLKKPGAEKMASFFGLTPAFEDVETVEDWTGEKHGGEPFFYYRQKCNLYKGSRLIASADGSCNSWEKKYRYRQQERVCPNCGKPTIIKGKAEYGGGWLCFQKKGGCGAKFKAGDTAIEGQQVGQVPNSDIAEQVNTILKMAQKRALVAAVLIATNASDQFTQDMEDFIPDGEWHEAELPTVPPPAAEKRIEKADTHEIGYTRANEYEVDGILQKLRLPAADAPGMVETAQALGANVTSVDPLFAALEMTTAKGTPLYQLTVDQLTTLIEHPKTPAALREAAALVRDAKLPTE